MNNNFDLSNLRKSAEEKYKNHKVIDLSQTNNAIEMLQRKIFEAREMGLKQGIAVCIHILGLEEFNTELKSGADFAKQLSEKINQLEQEMSDGTGTNVSEQAKETLGESADEKSDPK